MSTNINTNRKIRLSKCKDHIPRSLQTIYNQRNLGIVDWLDRIGPQGRKTRYLWVDVEKCKEWARCEDVTLGPTLTLHEGAAG